MTPLICKNKNGGKSAKGGFFSIFLSLICMISDTGGKSLYLQRVSDVFCSIDHSK